MLFPSNLWILFFYEFIYWISVNSFDSEINKVSDECNTKKNYWNVCRMPVIESKNETKLNEKQQNKITKQNLDREEQKRCMHDICARD